MIIRNQKIKVGVKLKDSSLKHEFIKFSFCSLFLIFIFLQIFRVLFAACKGGDRCKNRLFLTINLIFSSSFSCSCSTLMLKNCFLPSLSSTQCLPVCIVFISCLTNTHRQKKKRLSLKKSYLSSKEWCEFASAALCV